MSKQKGLVYMPPPTSSSRKDPTKEVSFADRIRDAKYNLHCIVCGMGSNRTDWKKTDNTSYVACDGHTDQEISDAQARQKAQDNATANNDALAAGGAASSADLTPSGAPAGGKQTPQGSSTVVQTPSGVKPTASGTGTGAGTNATSATGAALPNAVTSPTAGQQLRSTQAPTAAPNPESASKDVKAPEPGTVAPKGVDPTKAA